MIDEETLKALKSHDRAREDAQDAQFRAKKAVEDGLAEALRGRLIEIASRAPVNTQSLRELEQTARLSREILAVGADPRALRQAFWPNALNGVNGVTGGMVEPIQYATLGNGMEGGPVYSSPSENFGATLIREALSFLGDLKKQKDAPSLPEDPCDGIVKAIVLAKKEGDPELAKRLNELLEKFLGPPIEAKPFQDPGPDEPNEVGGSVLLGDGVDVRESDFLEKLESDR